MQMSKNITVNSGCKNIILTISCGAVAPFCAAMVALVWRIECERNFSGLESPKNSHISLGHGLLNRWTLKLDFGNYDWVIRKSSFST